MTVKLTGQIVRRQVWGELKAVPAEVGGAKLQAKTAFPSHSEQTIKPDDDYDGLAVVTVKPTPRLPACVASFSEGIHETVENVVNIAVGVSVTAEKIYTHYLYNGVRLPRIPDSVLASYPYAWIRNNANSNVYELVYFPNGAYFDGSSIWDKGSVHGPRYQIARDADMDTATWQYVDSTYSAYGIDGNRTVLWSNHDIPNGSATATDIYFKATEPVPTD